MAELARGAALGLQALVGDAAAASRPARAVLTPSPLTLSSLQIPRRTFLASPPRHSQPASPYNPGGALPHAGAPGASRTPSPRRLAPLCPADAAPMTPPPPPSPARRDASQPRPALAAPGHARKKGASPHPALGRGRPGAESEASGI